MKKCRRKHTAFQPTNDQWGCPQCGAGFEAGSMKGQFYVVEAINKETGCEKMHERERCLCDRCGFTGSGKVVAEMLARRGEGMMKTKKDIEKLFSFAFGEQVDAVVVAAANSHIFSIGDIPSREPTYAGGMIDTLEWSLEEGGFLRVVAGIVAKDTSAVQINPGDIINMTE